MASSVRKTSPAYTVETLENLRAHFGPAADLVLLIGADQYERLDTWHRWEDLFAYARIAVFGRPHHTVGNSGGNAAHVTLVQMTPLDISSTTIRRRIAAGEPVRAMVPDAVLDYIETHHLYSSQESRTR